MPASERGLSPLSGQISLPMAVSGQPQDDFEQSSRAHISWRSLLYKATSINRFCAPLGGGDFMSQGPLDGVVPITHGELARGRSPAASAIVNGHDLYQSTVNNIYLSREVW